MGKWNSGYPQVGCIFQRNPGHERALQDLGCAVSFSAIWFLRPSRLLLEKSVADRDAERSLLASPGQRIHSTDP